MMDNYNSVNETLYGFIQSRQIPNIIFHGDCFTKKKDIVVKFMKDIYMDDKAFNNYVMFVDCAHGKGIKFVREDLKHFAKTNVSKSVFKSIVLFNADKLTIDAQSALRRCIEIFSHSTRFFMIVDNVSKLLKPILSRFCNIFIYEKHDKLYTQLNSNMKAIAPIISKVQLSNIFPSAKKLYDKGISGLNVMEFIRTSSTPRLSDYNKHYILFYLNKIKKDIRDEKLLLTIILQFYVNKSINTLTDVHYI